MKKLIVAILLCASIPAMACEVTKYKIYQLIKSGDVVVTFKPNGEADTVTCNTDKYTAKQCELTGEHIFEYYKHHPKKG